MDYVVSGPDGKKYRVTAPQGAGADDAINYVRKTYYGPKPTAPAQKRTDTALQGNASSILDQVKNFFIAPPSERDKTFKEALQKGATGIPAEIGKELGAGVGAMKGARIGTDVQVKPGPGAERRTMEESSQRASNFINGLMEALWSPVTGTLTSAVGRPVEEATGVRREITGNVAAMLAGAKGAAPTKAAEEVAGAVGPDVSRETKVPGAEEPPPPPKKAPAPAKEPAQGGEASVPAVARERTPLAEPTKPPGDPDFKWPTHAEATDREAYEIGRRLDDVLYRMQTNADADKVEARHYLQDLPPEYRDPAFQERAYHEIESRMVDPKAPLSEDVQKFLGSDFGRWYTEQNDLYKWIRGHPAGRDLIGPENLPDTSRGYIHRIAKGQGAIYDRGDPEAYRRDVLTGGRTLSKKASGLQERKYFVVEDKDGQRVFVPRDRAAELKEGQELTGSNGRKYQVKYATTREIEQSTRDPKNGYRPQDYHKNAVVNTVENVLRLRRVKRAMQVTDVLKKGLTDRGLLYEGAKAADAPNDFIPTRLPQFLGARMHPSVAHALDDFFGPGTDQNDVRALEAVNRFLTRSIFFNPVPHLQNVGTFWTIARGGEWLRPTGWKMLVRNGGRAIQDVANQGPITRALLRRGAALQYPRIANQNFYKLMIERMSGEIDRDPQTWAGLAKNFGFKTPVDLVKQIYRTSSRAMWLGNDVFMVQHVLDLMDRGLPMDAAIQQAERYIPNYRIPSELWYGPGGRAASQLIQSPNSIMFGRYKYDQIKMIANLASDLKKGGNTSGQALTKAIVLVGLATAAYPAGDYVVSRMLNTPDARLKRSGPLSPVDALYQESQGDKDWLSALSTIVSPAPATEAFTEFVSGRDEFGRPISEPGSTELGKWTQRGEWATGKIAPVGEAISMTKPGGAARVAGRQIGLEIPSPGSRAAKSARVVRAQRREGRRRERNDAIENALRKLSF